MTVVVFLGSLLGCIFLGIPVAFSLLLCGAALMLQLNLLDCQVKQPVITPRLIVVEPDYL